jgi:hypothetical protein
MEQLFYLTVLRAGKIIMRLSRVRSPLSYSFEDRAFNLAGVTGAYVSFVNNVGTFRGTIDCRRIY